MDAAQLKSAQEPLKQKYRDDPRSALITLRAEGRASGLSCRVETGGFKIKGNVFRQAQNDSS